MAFAPRRERATHFLGRGRSVRVKAWLTTLAIVPLLGVASLVYGQLFRIVESHRDLATIDRSIDGLVDLSELRVRVLAESYWATAVALTPEAATGPSSAQETSAVGAAEQLRQAQFLVNDALHGEGLTAIEEAVVAQRSRPTTNVEDLTAGYEDIAAAVEDQFTESLDDLASIAEPIDGGAILIRSARALDAATTAAAEATINLIGSSEGPGMLEPHNGVVRSAATDLDGALGVLSSAVTRSSLLAVASIGFMIVTSLLFAFGLARGIGDPLRRLAGGAQTLRDGAEGAALRPSGPTEIREAMLAINEAAAHIRLAERQAQALAQGDLQNAALSESAPGALGKSLQEAVRTLAGSLNEREEFRRRLAHEATHDSLTQVANRGASLGHLNQSLARAARTGSTVAVLFIDLDGFKGVNDHHGHPVGDAVLWALAKRLTKSVRVGDHVGRLGGDEFLVIAEPVSGAEEALTLANRVAAEMSQPLLVGSTCVTITVSIGVAMAGPKTGLTATEILHDADLAVYRAKELGRSRIEVCDAALQAELARRAAIAEALRDAIPNGELTMYYQPILDANTAELVSLEALLRWHRPGVGFVPPDVFIPIAERTDLILEVDKWVVQQVVDQLQAWSGNKQLRRVPIGINISGRHLALGDFVSHILDPIRNAALDPSRVILEVTEGALLQDLDAVAVKLQILRDQGIRIAIDDFGTGYTSLAHLRSLPVDILKIDRTFIHDESAGSLVKLIIDTGHLLGATITSEGIETVEQAANLTELGSDALQGYLFARPMTAAHVEQELAASTENEPAFLH